MKGFTITILFVVYCILVIGNDRDHEKVELQKLVSERETRFGEYSRAADSRSGIFGNKTRKDLHEQVEILTAIVKTDNRIISLLENYLDYRSFQRAKMTYSQAELDEKNRRLTEITTNLSQKLQAVESENKLLEFKMKWSILFNYLSLLVIVVLMYLWWRERKINGNLKSGM
jgi:hypothetical protein